MFRDCCLCVNEWLISGGRDGFNNKDEIGAIGSEWAHGAMPRTQLGYCAATFLEWRKVWPSISP
jgi:hypothetical protein